MPPCNILDKLPLKLAVLEKDAFAWMQASKTCIETAGPLSNASHQSAIVANEQSELQEEFIDLPKDQGPVAYRAAFAELCARKRREIRDEFQFNIILDNSYQRWGDAPSDFVALEDALTGVPDSMTRSNPQELTFTRRMPMKNEPETLAQTLVGRDEPKASIEVFSTAQSPTNLPATPLGTKTLRHEMGHVVEKQVPQKALEEFFGTILDWRRTPWELIESAEPPYANWLALRKETMELTGFTRDAEFDAWLQSLSEYMLVARGQHEFVKVKNDNNVFLTSFKCGTVPKDVAFSYARFGRGEYFAELYSMALSNPAWLHDQIEPTQIVWLKRNVFHTPATAAEWKVRLGSSSPDTITKLLRVFTFEQAKKILDVQPKAPH